MSMNLLRRATAIVAGAATLFGATLIASSAATAVQVPSGYNLSLVACAASPYFLNQPMGLAIDSGGNLFVADSAEMGVKKIAPGGAATRVAGYVDSGQATAGPALDSMFTTVSGVAVDSGNNLYIADQSSQIAKVTSGTLSLIGSGFSGPKGVAVDSAGNLYIADTGNHKVKKRATNGVITTIAGTGTAGAPIAGTATSSPLRSPSGVAVDSSGNVYIADSGNHRIEKVTSEGVLSIIAGTGTSGSPTAGTATSSNLNNPLGVAVDTSGNVYIADSGNHRIEKVTVGGVLSVLAGTGTAGAPTVGDGASSKLSFPVGIVVDSSGIVYVGDMQNNCVEKLVSSVSAPAAPTTLSATPGDTTASVSFTVGSDGGGAITKYQYTTNDGGSWSDAEAGTTSPISITGLTNDTNYSIKIRAYNSAGGGTASSAVSVTPTAAISAPSAPTSVSATAGDASASITFTAGFNGGASISKYQFTTNDGGSWSDAAAGTTSPISVTGLTNGTNYSIKIRAYNSAGGGTASSAVSVTPRTTPSAPTSLIATPGDRSVSIAFTPGSDGGSALLYYRYSTDGGSTWNYVGLSDVSPLTISDLANGTSYSIRLQAGNIVGVGASSVDVSVTPRTTPSAPTALVATPGNGSASIAFTPSSDGGATITKYQYKVGSGAWTDAVGTTSPITITGLPNYQISRIKLRSVNSVGDGTASAAVQVWPRLAGPSLIAVRAEGTTRIRAFFAAVNPPGGSLDHFWVSAYVKGTTYVVSSGRCTFAARNCLVVGLTAGTEYDVAVCGFFTLTGSPTVLPTLDSNSIRVRTNK